MGVPGSWLEQLNLLEAIPSHPTKSTTGRPVRLAQHQMTWTTQSRVNRGTHVPVGVPQVLFKLDMLFHEFREDFTLALNFCSRRAILRSLPSLTHRVRGLNAAVAFSKNSFCQRWNIHGLRLCVCRKRFAKGFHESYNEFMRLVEILYCEV